MAEIITQEEYDKGRIACATPDRAKQIGRHFMRRAILNNPVEDAFAREATVKITGWDDDSLMPTFTIEKIADDGRPLGEDIINLDGEGTILGGDLAEHGYLLGGADPGPEGWNLTKDEMMQPEELIFKKVERREDLKRLALPLPEPEYLDGY